MHDILPKDEDRWKAIWNIGEKMSELYDFSLIETPILESAALFEAGIGVGTDIVEKEMFSFKTKGDEVVVLRPEGTAPVMRSYIQHHLGRFSSPLKVYYVGQMFRYEKPQAGRYRAFHQWGFETIGEGDPFYDAQTILLAVNFLKELGIKNVTLKINTVGCRVCRPNYRKKLLAYYKGEKKHLCADCLRRYEKNPMRLLDCKEEECKKMREDAPIILDHLCQSCNGHMKEVLELVEENGLEYEPDPYLVRGLDYYNRTVFELIAKDSAGFALAGGGRYDYLGELVGGRMIPAVGVSLGMERLVEYMEEKKIFVKAKKKPGVFFVIIGDPAKKVGFRLIHKLRESNMRVLEAVGKKSLKAQLKAANRAGTELALMLGQKECFEETVIIRDMRTGVQETVLAEKIIEETKKRLR
ncbi:histidine--tRNA ligase [Candidatus Jorgensenbacteria bacterium RIFCSPLOWO2_01_FULL_45_25b]|uniref:Histidine--tRNA ligase n=1 Tax=Candidatus Jorgensenbacteria bacterium RIFCSPLOWO2_01_FULL_45_25b TaxID=1798471 RepID=A0A1F6BZ31_9BACT|nr:MAG: histidine--tRNA ligase [Candidatus Jorgensenbacteria bacterium RIFCSPLOWO2_01_FULL_45_25b]